MQTLRAFTRSLANLKAALPHATVRLAVALDQSTRRPPLPTIMLQQLVF